MRENKQDLNNLLNELDIECAPKRCINLKQVKKDNEFLTAKRDKSITFSTTSSLEAHQPA